MMLLCLGRTVIFVKSEDDFALISSGENVYLTKDMDFEKRSPLDVEHGFLDCIGHQIRAFTQLFGAVRGLMIRNCAFQLQKQFAGSLEQTTLSNVTITTSETAGCQTVIANSYFYGVRIEAASQFAASTSGTLFAGCALSILVGQAEDKAAFLGQVSSCTLQNCFLNATVSARNAAQVAGLAASASDVLLLSSRFISSIAASFAPSGSQPQAVLGGCMADAFKTLLIKNCDFAAKITTAGQFSAVGGVVAAVTSDYALVLQNSSCYFSLVDSAASGFGCIGSLVGSVGAAAVQADAVSTFNSVRLANVTEQLQTSTRIVMAGLIAVFPFSKQDSQIQRCFVFGGFKLHTKTGMSVIAGGCIGKLDSLNKARFELAGIAVSCEMSFTTAEKNSNEFDIGGIAGETRNCSIIHSEFYGNISTEQTLANSFYIGAATAYQFADVKIDFCAVWVNISIAVNELARSGYVGLIAAETGILTNSLARGNLSVAETGERPSKVIVGGISAAQSEIVGNCSVDVAMLFKTSRPHPMQGNIGALVGISRSDQQFSNLTARAVITAPEGIKSISTVFGSIYKTKAANIVVAVDVLVAGASARAYAMDGTGFTVSKLFIDCGRAGNDANQEFCRDDLTTGSAVAELGEGFTWNASYNGGYPYLNALPVPDDSNRYVLPDSGGFGADDYYIDDAGLPFPKTDFQACRGACYGTYSSPACRVCDDAFEYCIDADRARREFPDDSCIAENALCTTGASFCTSEAEMLMTEATGEYSCQNACPGCQNGYCSQSECVCDIYNEESSCTYNCRADEPTCFGDEFLMCDGTNTECIPVPFCENMPCVHGGCVDLPFAHCECENQWEGDDCSACKAGFDPDTNCKHCRGAMEVIGGSCACGTAGIMCDDGFFCSAGRCQKGCMLLGINCSRCDPGRPEQCGGCPEGLVLKKGVCTTPKKGQAAAIAGGVVGGCVVLAAVGVTVFFVLKSKKASAQYPSNDRTKAQPGRDQELKKVQTALNEQKDPLNAQNRAYTTSTSLKSLPNGAGDP